MLSLSKHEVPEPGFGIYIHWPFCRSKCPYCDFNSHVRESVDQARWRRALLAELEHFAVRAPRRPVTSIFFGGGTPSLMPPETAGALIARVRALWPVAPDLEITLEANPTSVEAARLREFRDAGVNRASLGVQSLRDEALAFLGRQHSAREAMAAYETAAGLFARTSFDLIYARPGQGADAWRAELREALSLAGEHLSLYTLTIEPNTGFAGAVARGAWSPPDADANAELFEATQELCEAAGQPAYEISNHARPGAECRHNLTYWRYGDYAGIGPGAHGRLQGSALRQRRKPEAWLDAVEAAGHGTEEESALDPADRAAEALLMGLRLDEGLWFANFERAAGIAFDAFVPDARTRPLVEAGLLAHEPQRLRATASGRRVLDAVLGRLLPG